MIWKPTIKSLPGLALCAGLAALSVWTGGFLHVPSMLLVLLLGIGVRAAGPEWLRACDCGVRFAGNGVLRLGIALLGSKLSLSGVHSLGLPVFELVLLTVGATILTGYTIARWLRLPHDVASISATAVAVCGASAALATSAVVPSRTNLERETAMVIVLVSLLSTAVMLLYPWLAHAMSFDVHQTSILLGAAIHDVAQVAGAGLSISPQVGVEAVTVKMIRVACLLPVVTSWGLLFRRAAQNTASARGLLPWFLVAFFGTAALANSGIAPPAIVSAGAGAATWLLTAAVASIGLHISIGDLRGANRRLWLAIAAQTAAQLIWVIALIHVVM